MPLPMVDDRVDLEETCRMVDAFLDAGFNYFDTAHGYLGGKSETALRSCLTCRYCTEVCPQGIAIPDLFSLLNAKRIWNNWNTAYYYNNISTKEGTRAKDCLRCGACEGICPQHLPIRELLLDVSKEFDK